VKKITETFRITISKQKEMLWNIWSNHPKNARNRSEAILKLIKDEVLANKGLYEVL